MTNQDQLALKLNRFLARRRFGPLVLWFSSRRHFDIDDPADVRIDFVGGTITISRFGDAWELLFEELQAIELLPRTPIATVERSTRGRTKRAQFAY